MMTSTQIRQSFLDFFRSKQHTIVPSSSLMPDSPNLLFTNAGMNQFVPIFLNQTPCPYAPGRAADTQKCIRAGGKHNDLDDVGLDTYHHTFFEMLGNWSFGDYFKQEAISWAWELVIEVWKFPPQRLYATVYNPDKAKGDPSEFDQEAWDIWAAKFRSVGLDPAVHIVNGNKKDNFWMMGDTGPCGPCSELHVDLTPSGDTRGLLVNKGTAECIEIWNNVFIQFNANPDGTFSPLPAKHVDTGMGFERVTSIMQGTKMFTDFANAKISNYETDIFRPIFDELERMTAANGTPKKYGGTLPGSAAEISNSKSQIAEDIAFRVIGDHIRTLSFAIADGIQPGNNDRNYVLRRILRRAVRYGRTLGFHQPFFYKLVDVLAATMGDVFPEIRTRKQHVREVLKVEEEAFNRTLDEGLSVLDRAIEVHVNMDRIYTIGKALLTRLEKRKNTVDGNVVFDLELAKEFYPDFQALVGVIGIISLTEKIQFLEGEMEFSGLSFNLMHFTETILNPESRTGLPLIPKPGEAQRYLLKGSEEQNEEDRAWLIKDALSQLSKNFEKMKLALEKISENRGVLSGRALFVLYDTYGFPSDLTELIARERGWRVDNERFNQLMEGQRARARAAQKKTVIELSQIETKTPTRFLGYDALETPARVLEVVALKDKTAVVLDTSTCYAEMGGQLGDTGELTGSGQLWRVVNTQKSGNTWLHFLDTGSQKSEDGSQNVDAPVVGAMVTLTVEKARRDAIQRHHTVTHLLHWALHEVVSKEASQKGSFVGPDKLTFDFNSAALTPAQVADIEELVNERIVENAGVSWTEVAHADVKHRKDVMQFFGDKYGDTVRVVQIGGGANKLDGYSMELCGGTHTRATGEIGLFRIVGENAIAAGVRRIEAVAGLTAFDAMRLDRELIRTVAGKVSSPIHELEKKIDLILAHQKELEKQLKAAAQREAAGTAKTLLAAAQTVNGTPAIIASVPGADGDTLQTIADALKGAGFKGVIVLGGAANGAVALVAAVSAEFTAKAQAGKLIQAIAPIVGGKGGGKPDNARGGGKDASKLDEALAKVKSLLG